ncbi:MAG: CBS domain-containing protein [Myxococcota bacterium]
MTVETVMTPSPHSIGKDQTMAKAHEVMRQYRIRHLPVLEAGQIIGVVTERDLHLMETLPDVKPEEVQVEDAMTSDPYIVDPATPVEEVALAMAEHKYGCAVVMKDGKLKGIFTTVDALRALAALIRAPKRATTSKGRKRRAA